MDNLSKHYGAKETMLKKMILLKHGWSHAEANRMKHCSWWYIEQIGAKDDIPKTIQEKREKA